MLAGMSADERQQALEELSAHFKPSAIEFLRRRAAAKLSGQAAQPGSSAPGSAAAGSSAPGTAAAQASAAQQVQASPHGQLPHSRSPPMRQQGTAAAASQRGVIGQLPPPASSSSSSTASPPGGSLVERLRFGLQGGVVAVRPADEAPTPPEQVLLRDQMSRDAGEWAAHSIPRGTRAAWRVQPQAACCAACAAALSRPPRPTRR